MNNLQQSRLCLFNIYPQVDTENKCFVGMIFPVNLKCSNSCQVLSPPTSVHVTYAENWNKRSTRQQQRDDIQWNVCLDLSEEEEKAVLSGCPPETGLDTATPTFNVDLKQRSSYIGGENVTTLVSKKISK